MVTLSKIDEQPGPSSTTTFYGYDYLVYTDGTYYYAVNWKGQLVFGSSGNIGANGSSAAAVINACITILASGGDIVVMDGFYPISATVAMSNSNVILEGISWNTWLQLKPGVNNKLISVSGNNCVVKNMQLDGNYTHQTASYSNCILIYFGNNFTADHVYAHDSWNEGIDFEGATGGWCINSYITHTGADGLVSYGCTKIIYDNLIVYNNGLRQLANNAWFSSCSYCTASNLILDTASDSNFEIQGGGISNAATAIGNTATNLICLNGALGGIGIDGNVNGTYFCRDSVISHFYVSSSGGWGISAFNYAQKCEFADGFIESSTASGARIVNFCSNIGVHHVTISGSITDGINVSLSCSTNSLVNNTLIGNGGYGINIATYDCVGNLVSQNIFQSNTIGTVNDNGQGTMNTVPINSVANIQQVVGQSGRTALTSLAINGTITVILSQAPVAGNTIIAVIGYTEGQSVTSITEANVAWSKAFSTTSYVGCEVWYGVVSSSPSTSIAVVIGGAATTRGIIVDVAGEFSGVAVSPVDKTALATGSSGYVTSTGTVTTTAQNQELFIGAVTAFATTQSNQSPANLNGFGFLDGALQSQTSLAVLIQTSNQKGTPNSQTLLGYQPTPYEGCIVTFKATTPT